jgi:arylsulfatase A-like enzyme
MGTAGEPSAARRTPGQLPLSPTTAVLWSLALGLCGGYLDLLFMLWKSTFWHEHVPVRIGRDFSWTLPVSHAILLLIPGLVVAVMNRLRPGLVSLRAGTWLFAAMALWAALLRLPLYGAGSLLLAVGMARLIGDAVASRFRSPRPVRRTLAGLLGLLGILAALSSGREAIRESRAVAGLPRAPAGARNVILIVWDTVRAYDLGAYGSRRNTTPNLSRWARRGVRYHSAMAPAPWTYPSHGSIFTGQWPFQINTQWKFTLDTPYPTLAEYLSSRGYQTAGFAANTQCCNYETGLARGFAHFEDYTLTPRSLLGRSVPGNWILMNVLYRGLYYDKKWIGLQSRGARGTNQAFFEWMRRRRPDRPFLAFLNYFDAHEPYIAPPAYEGRFGLRPRTPGDYNILFNFVGLGKDSTMKREFQMARDGYDDCIAFLDDQLGRLLGELQRQGLLDETVVIITSDHGEAFGDHGTFGHSYSLFLDEIGVPLVILAPGAPAGRVVGSPVSLRDLPATVVDQAGLSAGSPFPGRSLAAYWRLPPGPVPQGVTSPAFSEQAGAAVFLPRARGGGDPGGFQMSLVAAGRHYIRDGVGKESLYDLKTDPFERINLMDSPDGRQAVGDFRGMLLEILREDPGSIEVEGAYLDSYRRGLEALVPTDPTRRVAARP